MGLPGRIAVLAVALFLMSAAGAPSWAAPAASTASTGDDLLPPPAISAGQPPVFRFGWGVRTGYDFEKQQTLLGISSEVTTPPPLLPNWLELSFEGTLGMAGGLFSPGLGARIGVPWFGVGFQQRLATGDLGLDLSLRLPLRRGGLFHQGDLLRVDYLPAEEQLQAGFAFRSPFERYRMTRRAAREAVLPHGSVRQTPGPAVMVSPEMESDLADIEQRVLWMDRLTTPRFREGKAFAASAAAYREHLRLPGHTADEEEAAYHRGLDQVFTAAMAGDTCRGLCLARAAESLIFARVLVPFDQKLGQQKKPTEAGGYCAAALAAFDTCLADRFEEVRGSEEERAAKRALGREAFRRVLASIEKASLQARDRWRESFLFRDDRARLAWLPLGYGLRADQYDTQAKWDSVLSRLTQQPFADCNSIRYLMTEQFHLELKRMIRETESYQVTIVHDFRARTASGQTDIYGWDVVVDGYLAAFTRAVRELDAGRRTRLPQFFLFLDEHYYSVNRERGIVTYLEHLYSPRPLHLRNKDIEDQVNAAHDSLLVAVGHSRALANVDKTRLAEVIRVHVNITNPVDPSFNLDLMQRDHRKIALRDVSEEDPGSGVAIVTGEGIGEHYNGMGWEDRGIVVQGPALVQVKAEIRQLFLSQGFAEREVPECLRPQPYPADYADRCVALRARDWTTPVSMVMNETGFGYKKATVLKAAIYDLAPDSSVVLAFDSLWLSDFWAGMFVGAALRGAHLFPVGPTPENAPSHAAYVLYLMRQNLDLLFQAQEFFRDDIAAAHGLLRVGIYAHDVPTHDFRRRGRTFLAGRASQDLIRGQIPLDPSVDTLITKFTNQFDEVPIVALQLRPRPFLHMKFQFFATREGIGIMRRPEWAGILRRHLEIRQAQVAGRANEGVTPKVLRTIDSMRPGSVEMLPAYENALDAACPGASRRMIFTTTVGSHNQNSRSLIQDGEVSVAVSGYDGMITATDFVFILYIAKWPTERSEFDRLFPPQPLPLYIRPVRGFMKSQS